jgi:protein required for attachment to host cells
MSKIWVVVSDTTRARIFNAPKGKGPLTELAALSHPEGRLHEGDLVSDRSGRDRNSGSGSHDMGHEVSAKEEEADRFASYVCEELEAARVKGDFLKLYLVAAPQFLGLLRKHKSSGLDKLVVEEISKNLAGHSPEEIRKALPEYL